MTDRDEDLPVVTATVKSAKEAANRAGLHRPHRHDESEPVETAPEDKSTETNPAAYEIPDGRLSELRSIAKDITDDHVMLGQLQEQIAVLQQQSFGIVERLRASRANYDRVQSLAQQDARVPAGHTVVALSLETGVFRAFKPEGAP